MEQHSCLTFAVDCGMLSKGAGSRSPGSSSSSGSVYLLLAAVFGR